MIQIQIKRLEKEEDLKVEFYDILTRIPLNIILRQRDLPSTTIKYDNFDDGNFVEFRFDEEWRDLCEVTMISINRNAVSSVDEIPINKEEGSHCVLLSSIESQEGKRKELKAKVLRSSNAVCVIFGETTKLTYYRTLGQLYFGIDLENNLKSVYLEGLSEENLKDIFGF